MTKKILFTLFLLLIFPIQKGFSQYQQRPLRVVSLNAYLLCVGPRCLLREVPSINERMISIAEWLKEESADIVFMQEIWQPEQLDFIKERSGYPHAVYFGETSDLAILSYTQLTHVSYLPTHWQGSYSEDCKKGIVGYRYGLGLAEMEWDGQNILLASAHPIARRASIDGFASEADAITPERIILQLDFWNALKSHPHTGPLIFAGDFNMNPDSLEYAHFNSQFGLLDSLGNVRDYEKRDLCTYCGENSLAQQQNNPTEGVIDYIFVNQYFRILDAKIYFPKPDLSDHQPLMATLSVQDPIARQQYSGPPLKDPIDGLIQYIKNVSLSPYCYLSYEMGWRQRERTIEFLESIRPPS